MIIGTALTSARWRRSIRHPQRHRHRENHGALVPISKKDFVALVSRARPLRRNGSNSRNLCRKRFYVTRITSADNPSPIVPIVGRVAFMSSKGHRHASLRATGSLT